MTFLLPFSSTIFFICGLMLSYFCYVRFQNSKADFDNVINFHYFKATLYVSIALFLYSFFGLLISNLNPNINFLGRLGCAIAVLSNALGFSHFFLIPIFNWVSIKWYLIAKHILYFFILFLAFTLIVYIPNSFSDNFGVIHWKFSVATGVLASVEMNLAFLCNIVLLARHFYRLKKLSIINVVALILTFTFTGFAGTYQYLGNSVYFLYISSVLLYLGISAVFFTSFRSRMLLIDKKVV